MTYVTLAFVIALAAWLVREVVRARRARRHVFDEKVRPFDPMAVTHQGWIDTRSDQADAYRASPGAHPSFALRCTMRLVPEEREPGMALRKWRVVDRLLEKNAFGLKVSTGEVIPVLLDAVDERVALDIEPRGGGNGQLECVACLPDRECVEVEGTVGGAGANRTLHARRLAVLAPGGDVDAVGRRSRGALRWILMVGMLGFGAALVVNETPFVVKCFYWVVFLFYLWLNPHRYKRSGHWVVDLTPLRFPGGVYRGTRAAMAETPPREQMPRYTTHDILRFPLDVVAPGGSTPVGTRSAGGSPRGT